MDTFISILAVLWLSCGIAGALLTVIRIHPYHWDRSYLISLVFMGFFALLYHRLDMANRLDKRNQRIFAKMASRI